MKTFEERFTAWLDGAMEGEELRSFERDYPLIIHEKADYRKLKTLLRENDFRSPLRNPDFFNRQLMAAIAEDSRGRVKRGRTSLLFGLPRLVWGGLAVLTAGFALFFSLIPRTDYSDPRARYVAEVLKARTGDPKIKATVDNQKDMTVIKLQGLDKLSPNHNPHQ